MLLYDYKCTKCGAVEEHLVANNEVMFVSCQRCGDAGSARQLAAPRFKLPGWDAAYPTAYSKWAKQHEKAGHPVDSIPDSGTDLRDIVG